MPSRVPPLPSMPPPTARGGPFSNSTSMITGSTQHRPDLGDIHRQHRGGCLRITASAAGVSTPASFSLTNKAGAAANVAAISGSGHSATANSAFAQPLVVKITDQYGNAVTGVKVKFYRSCKKCQRQLQQRHSHDHRDDRRDRPAVRNVYGQHRGGLLQQRHGLGGRRQHAGLLQGWTGHAGAAASIT